MSTSAPSTPRGRIARIATVAWGAFRQATGISIKEFATRPCLELARGLLHDPRLTVDEVAARCGFQSARQLRPGGRQREATR